jgi:hypothetical protein
MKRLLGVLRSAAVALTVALVGCGGGGSGSSPIGTFVAPTEFRAVHASYFSGALPYVLESVDHTNVWWARDDDVIARAPGEWHVAMAQQLLAARAAGYTGLVLHLPTDDTNYLRPQLTALSEDGSLAGWDSITLYHWDEPDSSTGGNLSDAELAQRVTKVRQVAFDIPNLLTAKIGVFYQCATGRHPAVKSFDLVGCYRYEGSGCALLESDFEPLRHDKSTTGLLWLMLGGADIGNVGRQDPACWEAYAQKYPDVWGYVFFMRQSGADPKIRIIGIRENGMHTRYCETGRRAMHPKETPRC